MCQSVPIRDETADIDPFSDVKATLKYVGFMIQNLSSHDMVLELSRGLK